MENVHKDSLGEMNAAELDQSLRQSSVFLIDLMSKDDFTASHIPGAVNIPVEELKDHITEIPKDKNIVVACRRGLMKSDLALQQLHEAGFTNAKKLTGGTSGWFDFSSGRGS
jgi:rhodanese-related sulfurtransferase